MMGFLEKGLLLSEVKGSSVFLGGWGQFMIVKDWVELKWSLPGLFMGSNPGICRYTVSRPVGALRKILDLKNGCWLSLIVG